MHLTNGAELFIILQLVRLVLGRTTFTIYTLEKLPWRKKSLVTREGYDKLVHDLDELRTVKRKEVADKIKVARGYGDLSENAEYDAAKEEQAVVEARIADLEATLKVAASSTTASCPAIPFPSV